MTEQITAIVVDPSKRSIEQVMLTTKPGTVGVGTQIPLKEFKRIIGPTSIEFTYLAQGVALALGVASEDERDFWQYGPNSDPIPGIGLITGHDIMRDHASDSPISLETARTMVTFTKRIVRGTKIVEFPGGVRIARVAPIVEEGRGK